MLFNRAWQLDCSDFKSSSSIAKFQQTAILIWFKISMDSITSHSQSTNQSFPCSCCRILYAPWRWEVTTFWTSAPLLMGWSPPFLRRDSGVSEPGWRSTGRPSTHPSPGGSRPRTQPYQCGKQWGGTDASLTGYESFPSCHLQRSAHVPEIFVFACCALMDI